MELFAKMDVKAVQNGLIQKVGGVKHFSVLAAIASFADSKGVAFPSQDTLAEMVGYSRKTVNQYVGDLRKVIIDNEPILVVKQERTPKGRRNKYILSPKSGFWFGTQSVTNSSDSVPSEGQPEVTNEGQRDVTQGLQERITSINYNHLEQEPKEQDIIFDNAKAVLQYFREQYFNKYDVAYQPNWGRDQAMIKNKLMANFTDSQIKSVIDIVVNEYDKRWANAKFPRPTIGQLCSWLPNEALAIIAKQKDEAARIENESKKYEFNDEHFARLLDEI